MGKFINKYIKHDRKFFNKSIINNFPKDLSDIKNHKDIVLFPSGIVSKYTIDRLSKLNIRVSALVDNNKKLWGTKFKGIPIISPQQLKKLGLQTPIIVASVLYEKEIYKQLIAHGFINVYPLTYLNYLYPKIFNFRDYHERFVSLFEKGIKDKVSNLHSNLADKKSREILDEIIKFRLSHYYNVNMGSIFSKVAPYFDRRIISLSSNEVFVDCGAYRGETILDLLKFTVGKYKKIVAFEPDTTNAKFFKANLKAIYDDNIVLEKKGVFNKSTKVFFSALGSPESGISLSETYNAFSGEIDAQRSSIEVVSLDQYFINKEMPTFIKMDIEGAELDALKGAKNIIKNHKPKLAICVYHKPEDLWEIPLYIKKINPSYELYLRHYSKEVCETVCYAV